MAFKHPLCPQCVYHREHPEVCDQCEEASEFEPADENRGRRRPPKEKTVQMPRAGTVHLVDTRERLSGMQSPDLAIEGFTPFDPISKG